jgi:hypothetical protein
MHCKLKEMGRARYKTVDMFTEVKDMKVVNGH